ncbi:MAG TPA: hypothetical protein DCR48_03300 [Flavobacteriales bacterium]|nr:hypothetical protein [Flavobacteriales bacterium]
MLNPSFGQLKCQGKISSKKSFYEIQHSDRNNLTLTVMKKKAFDGKANNLTPRFIGTKEDFNKYLSGYCRNLVQKITKAYKLQIGQCEKCEEKNKQLDAAHVHGKERREIINSILKDFTMRDSMEINLNVY